MNLSVLHLRIHDQPYVVPLEHLQRVLAMAHFTRLPEPQKAPQVAGVLNLAGTLTPVVNARKALNLPTSEPLLDHRLLLLRADPAYLLWVDEVLGFMEVPLADFKPIRYQLDSPVEAVVRVPEGSLPVLRPEFFTPQGLWEQP